VTIDNVRKVFFPDMVYSKPIARNWHIHINSIWNFFEPNANNSKITICWWPRIVQESKICLSEWKSRQIPVDKRSEQCPWGLTSSQVRYNWPFRRRVQWTDDKKETKQRRDSLEVTWQPELVYVNVAEYWSSNSGTYYSASYMSCDQKRFILLKVAAD